MPVCIETVMGCLAPGAYDAERQTIADAHSDEDGFKNQWGLTLIRADQAYAQLELKHGGDTEPGSGQTVGLIDTGIDAGHPVFAGKTISEHFFSRAQDETGREFSHGTAVASIIAARQNAMFDYPGASPAQGVAWGADIAMFAVPTGADDGVYEPFALTAETGVEDRWAAWFNHLIDWSSGGRTLDFVNVSVGIHGIIDQYSEEDLRAGFGDYIEALAQADTTDKTVFIWAAGNAHGDPCYATDFANNPDLCVNETVNAKSVDMQAGLPARIAELRGHLISVVAVAPDSDMDGDYEIADFSNRCGIAKDWCIAAPGEDVRVAYFGPYEGTAGARRNGTGGGTSFAAPMVTGALVVMKDYFRDELYNTDLVARLLATANKGGIYADADVYGQGLLDLAAATSPTGTPSIALDRTGRGRRRQFGGDRAWAGRRPRRRAHGRRSPGRKWRPSTSSARHSGIRSALSPTLRRAPLHVRGCAASCRQRTRATKSAHGPPSLGRSRGTIVPPRRYGWASMDTPRLGNDGGHLSLAGRALGLSTAGQAGPRRRRLFDGGLGRASAGFRGHDRLAAGGSIVRSARRLGRRARGPSRHEGSRRLWACGSRFGLRRGRGERANRCVASRRQRRDRHGERVGTGRADQRHLATHHERLRPPRDAVLGRRGHAHSLALAASSRRGRPRASLGAGRSHEGWVRAPQFGDGRSRTHGPADRSRGPVAAAVLRLAASCASARPGPAIRGTPQRRTPISRCWRVGGRPSDINLIQLNGSIATREGIACRAVALVSSVLPTACDSSMTVARWCYNDSVTVDAFPGHAQTFAVESIFAIIGIEPQE